MNFNTCIIPHCKRLSCSSSGRCHTHAGAHEQWIDNILASSGTPTAGLAPKTSKKKKQKGSSAAPGIGGSGLNFCHPQHLPLQSGLGLPGVDPRVALALSTGQLPVLPAVYQQQLAHNAANRRQESLYPDQAAYMAGQPAAMLPCLLVPSPSLRGANREVEANCDLSVFKLTPGHKRTVVPDGDSTQVSDGDSTNNDCQSSQDSRLWHASNAGASAEVHQDPSAAQQMQIDKEGQDSSAEGSSHCLQHSQPKPVHAQCSVVQQLQVENRSVQRSSSGPHHHVKARQEDHTLALSSQQQQTGTRECVSHHPSTQCPQPQGTQNSNRLSRSSEGSDEDVILVGVDDDVLIVEDGTVTKHEDTVKKNIKSKSVQSSALDQQALPSVSAGTECEESDDDCIVLDLSLGFAYEPEDSEQQNSGMHTVQSLEEQNNQRERGICEQVSQSALSTGQHRTSRQSTETVEPSQIMVLETVSLSEQQSVCVDQDATPKTYHQLSAESFYRCGCLKGRCGFQTVLPTQLELHLQEEHPYDVIYPCVHCGSREAGIHSLISHLEQHLAPQDFSFHCSDTSCEFLSSSPEKVLNHIQLCHPKQASHICWRCSSEFDSLAMFCLHVQQNLLPVVRCQLCSARDVDRQSILMHMASSHPDQDRLIAVHKVLICLERKVNHWDTDNNAEDLSVLKNGDLLMSGSEDDEAHSVKTKEIGIISPMISTKPRQDKSVPHEQPPSPDAQEKDSQEKDSQGSGTPIQKLKTSQKEDAIGSLSKGRQLRRSEDGTTNTSPSVKDKPAGTNTTADARKAKLSHTNSSCTPTMAKPSGTNTAAAEKAKLSHTSASHTAVRAKPSGANTTLAVVKALPATKTSQKKQNHARPAAKTTPKKYNHGHLAHQIELSESSEQCARMESGSLDSTVDILDTYENSARKGTQEKENMMHTALPGAASEKNDRIYSWIDYTYSLVEKEKFGCSICDHESRFLDNHVKHIHSCHESHFKGFACQRCGFISIDQNAQSEHRCDGSHHLRARSRIQYSEDDSTFNSVTDPLLYMSSAPAVNDSSSTDTENHVKTIPKRQHTESSSPSKRARTSSDIEDSLFSPTNKIRRSETGGILSLPSKQNSCPEMGSAASSESLRRFSGIQLVCNICGLRGSSRSGMQRHMYSQHGDIMACPVCSETLDNDCQLQRHLSDLHPDQCSAFERMKSQNFITQMSASDGGEGDGKEASAVSDRQPDSILSTTPSKKFKCELLACKLCGFSSRNTSRLKSHVYSEHPQVGKCPKCDVHLTGDHELYRHLCDAHFEEKDSLYQQHRYGSWIFKPNSMPHLFLCKLCGFSSTQSDDVHKHMYTEHKDEMKCPRCFVEIGSDQELYQHLSDDHADDRDLLYSQHCSVSWCNDMNSGDGPKHGEVGEKPREWVASHTSDRPTLLRIVKTQGMGGQVASPKRTSPRSKVSKPGAGRKNIVSSASSSAAKAGGFPQSSDLTECIPLILSGELNSEVPVTFSNSCSEMSMSVPLMTRQQYDELAAMEVKENMEYRCPHCTSDFKWRYRFYEHLCYHYHYRCFQCVHCQFLAFSGSAVVNHSRKTHDEAPSTQHLPKPTFEMRIDRVIKQSLACVTDPYTERRLVAYERVRQRKLEKRQQAKSTQQVKKLLKSTNPSKQKQELTRKSAKVFARTMMTGNTGKSPKRGRGSSQKVTWQSNTDTEDQGKWLKCPYCRSQKKTKQAVENEIRFHIHYKPYTCPCCQFKSSSEMCVKQHIASNHPQKSVVVNYEKNEHKEVRFQDLFNRAVELSRTAAKTDLMSSVKRKYRRKADTVAAGKTDGKTDTRPVKRRYRKRTKPVSAGQMDPAKSSGKELKMTTEKQFRSEPEIQCAHCSFVSKNRGTVTSHIIECHQDLLREGMNAGAVGVHKDTSSLGGSLLGHPSTVMDSSGQPPSMKNADIGHTIGTSQSSEDAQPSAQNKNNSSTENQGGSHTSSD